MIKKASVCCLPKIMALILTVLVSISVSAQTIKANLGKTTVKNAIEYLQGEYGYSVVVRTDKLNLGKTVNLNVDSSSIEDILKILFEGQNVVFSVEGKRISVSKKTDVQSAVITIQGKIIDEEAYPLMGAVIIEEGTKNSAVADVEGCFRMDVNREGTLLIQFLGYEDELVKISQENDFTISLTPKSMSLDEAVAVGYGSMTRRDITSAVGSFKPKPSERRDVLSVDQLIQGRVAGVNISTASGVPGASSRVSIRGIGSLNAGNEPLYVVDGIPLTSTSGDTGAWSHGESMTGLATINPADIESVEVLKDAASAAIYGSRGTNGVIIITTKQGKKGTPKVGFDASMSIGKLARTSTLDLASPDLLIETLNEGIDNYNIQYGKSIERLINPAPGQVTHNWLNDVLRTAFSRNISMSISGGTDNVMYYVSGGVKHQEGVSKGNDLDQYFLKTNVTGKIRPWVSFGVNSLLSYTHNARVASGYSGLNEIKAAVEQYPWDKPFLPNGEWATSQNILVNNNPLQAMEESDVWIKTYRALSTVYLQFHILPGLEFKTSIGEDFQSLEEHIYYTSRHQQALPTTDNPLGGQLIDSRKNRASLLWENTLSFDKKFDFGMSLNAVLGHSYQYDFNSMASQTGQGFASDTFDVNSVASIQKSLSSSFSEFALQSFFGRLSINHKNRYVASFTLRADGSSKFAPEYRYGYFPSASIGWNVNEENWWKDKSITFKVRASIGATGNQGGIGAYAYQALASGGINYNGVSGLGLSTAGNRELKWETAVQQDFGVDLSFWKGALSITADIYNKDTRNLLYSKPTMATTGYSTYTCNIGAMNNRGLELTLAANAGGRDFRWRGDFNISFVKNKLTQLLDDNDVITPDSFHGLKVGEEVGSFYMIKMLGIYQHDEDVPQYLYENEGVRAGDVIFDDYNEDGKIDANDRQFVGSANPNFSGGFNNTFTFRNFELSAFITYSYGNKVYEYWTGGLRLGNGNWPQLKSVCESRWTGPGTTNTTPRAIYSCTWNSTRFVNTRFLHDASYARLRSVTLGYNIPSRFLKKAKIDALRVYLQGDNLFVLTPWPYLDPEVSVSSNAATYGYDWLNPSQPRTFLIGVNLKF